MDENTLHVQDQVEYNRKFTEKSQLCEAKEAEISNLEKQILEQSGRKELIKRCLEEIRECGEILPEFDVNLWNSMVESVTISHNKTFGFLFRDGTRIAVRLPKESERNRK